MTDVKYSVNYYTDYVDAGCGCCTYFESYLSVFDNATSTEVYYDGPEAPTFYTKQELVEYVTKLGYTDFIIENEEQFDEC